MKWTLNYKMSSGIEEYDLGTDKLSIFRLVIHNNIVTAIPVYPMVMRDSGWISKIIGKDKQTTQTIIDNELR